MDERKDIGRSFERRKGTARKPHNVQFRHGTDPSKFRWRDLLQPPPSGGKNARKIRGSSPQSGGRERCADCTEITKSHSRLGYPLAASRQTFKSASPTTRGGERIVRARSLSPPLSPSSFLPMPPGLYVKEIREREREDRYRGNNATQWGGREWLLSIRDCISQILPLAYSDQGLWASQDSAQGMI